MSIQSPVVYFSFITLGCKVNQYETHSLREAWQGRGWVEVADLSFFSAGRSEAFEGSPRVLLVVNSCAVTAKAVAEVRAAIARAHRLAPEAEIIVTGCAAQVAAQELAALPGVRLLVPQSRKDELRTFPDLPRMEEAVGGMHSALPDSPSAPESREAPKSSGWPEQPALPPAFPRFRVSGYDRSRAVLKVQDGCSHRCSYCIVPLTRGPSRSRPAEESVAELAGLLEAGYREITINGINLAQYGRDSSPPHDFWDFLARCQRELAPRWAGRARLRLSSLEPGQLGEKALETLAACTLVAPHIHLSLQSGSAQVLRRMGRGHYDPAMLDAFFTRLRGIWPCFGLGADILTGFPGETRDNACETELLCESLPFSYAHVFPYSRRPGTPAADWPEQIAVSEKKHRAARLRALFSAKKQAFLHRLLALPRVMVACEHGDGSHAQKRGGVTEYYADCTLCEPPSHAFDGRESLAWAFDGRELMAAQPLRVERGCLIVRPEAYSESLNKGLE